MGKFLIILSLFIVNCKETKMACIPEHLIEKTEQEYEEHKFYKENLKIEICEEVENV